MRISDIYTPDVVTVEIDDTVLDAARRMREAHVGDVVVVEDAEVSTKPVGILTDRDIVVSLIAEGSDQLDRSIVGDAMTQTPLVVHADEDVDSVLDLMDTHGVRRVPVVDDDERLVGILSFDDYVDFMRHRMDALAGVVTTEISHEVDRDRPRGPEGE